MPTLEYAVIIHEAEGGGFWSDVPSLPGAGSQGESVEETVRNTRDAIAAIIEVMKERGEAVMPPSDIVVSVHVAA
jgi:predicted RNase H-like HicB family nuclease